MDSGHPKATVLITPHTMQIQTLDLESGQLCDVEIRLAQLANNDDQMMAIKGQMLLELVRHLRLSGPYPRALGRLFRDELIVFPDNPINRASVNIQVDWPDYGPKDGPLPRAHYRVNIQRPGSKLSTDVRSDRVEEIERAVWDAFGWSK
jgi:hypothetical protein